MSEQRLTRLEIAMFGWTGSNGVIGTQKEHSADLASIKQVLSIAVWLVKAARWLILALSALIALAGSDHAAAVLVAIIKGLGAIIKL